MPFNREKFLFYLFAAVLAVNASIFGFGLYSCSKLPNPKSTCPDLGQRFDAFSEKTLAAVLGLIAGAGVFGASKSRKPETKKSFQPSVGAVTPANAIPVTPNSADADVSAGSGPDDFERRRRRKNDKE